MRPCTRGWRIVSLLVLSVAGFMISISLPFQQSVQINRALRHAKDSKSTNGSFGNRTYLGPRLFEHYNGTTTNLKNSHEQHPSLCTKWTVLTIDREIVQSKSLDPIYQQIHDSIPASSHDWCTVVVASKVDDSWKSSNNAESSMKRIHFLSLEQLQDQGGAVGQFANLLLQTSSVESAYRNAGYLYALQQGSEYILDLDANIFLHGDEDNTMKELWTNIEDTFFDRTSKNLSVDIPLIGNQRFLNPHAYIFPNSLLGSTWPRGYSKMHQHPQSSFQIALTKTIPKKQIGVVQHLLHHSHLDLDAQGTAMMLRTDMETFLDPTPPKSLNPLLVPRHAVTPYNAKATLHCRTEALWATLIPITLPSRLGDIWRSYISQSLFKMLKLHTLVVPPAPSTISEQIKKEHTIAFNPSTIKHEVGTELDFFTLVPKLQDVLEEYQQTILDKRTASTLPEIMENLWIHLYEEGFIDLFDVELMQLWIQALMQTPYQFPQSWQKSTYFDNVILMGQFNFASHPKEISIPQELTSKVLEQLTEEESNNVDDEAHTVRRSQDQNHLVLMEDTTETTAFWVQKWREVFAHVVVRGPFSKQQLKRLREVHGVEAYGMDGIRWNHTVHDKGFYSPIENLMETLEDIKQDSRIEGVLYLHDDMLLNISDFTQMTDSSSSPLFSKFPADKVLATKKDFRDCYFDPRTAVDKDEVSQTSYNIYPNGTFSKLNGQRYTNDQALLESLQVWPWNPEHCIPRLVELAKDPRVEPYQEQEGDQVGSILVAPQEQADFLFVPTKFADEFIKIAALFLDHQVFLECAFPTIVDMLRHQVGAKVQTRNLCTSWDEGIRDTDDMIFECRKDLDGHGTSYGLFHPYKLSHGVAAWDTMFDYVAHV